MPKMKTRKSVSGRLKLKIKRKNGKKTVSIIKKQDGQDHFNARESGKVRRNKRTDNTMSDAHKKTIMRSMPYA